MAATLTRRTLRRARLGGRHTYRAAVRHKAALAAIAAAAVVTVGATAAAAHEAPFAFPDPPMAHSQMHNPMPDGFPGHPWGPRHG